MSKVDALRAMREAKYARLQAGTREARPVARKAAPVAPPEAAPSSFAPAAPLAPREATCGHKSMNGRMCTREAGHTAKSHRYS